MIRVRTLGSVELDATGGGSIAPVLAEPKSLALVVYLAAARPVGIHQRSHLLSLLWPDLDEARGREAFDAALLSLRESLGTDTLIHRGPDEVGLDPTRVWCDVHAFREALDGGRTAEALELYRGDFLPEFVLKDSRAFTEWLSHERGILREQAAAGARKLADQHAAGYEFTQALRWGRQVLELTPDDERALRRLLQVYERAGDRAGALRAYDQFAHRLREEFDSEPSAETQALVERLRRGEAELWQSPERPPEGSLVTPGECFGERYRIERELGAGGMATVYLAHDLKHDREVALKVLRPEIAMGMARERFVREILIVGRLQHPNIVPLFDSGESNGRLYFVMPYVKGESLRERLAREGALPIDEVVHLVRELASALTSAHAQDVIHRDIKPANILLIDRRAVLADFGIARAAQVARSAGGRPNEALTTVGIAIGTPAYMAPEQAGGNPDVDARADIYSLAMVAYEMLAGRAPFAGMGPAQVLAKQMAGEPRSILELREDVPEWLASLIMRCLDREPGSRAASTLEMLRWLDGGAQSERKVLEGRRVRPRVVSLLLVAAVVVTVVLTLRAFGARSRAARGVAPDTTLLVVLPLERDGPVADPTPHDNLLREGLSRWDGVELVDQFQVADALKRRPSVRSGSGGAELASLLGAGRFIRGSVSQKGNSSQVHAALYDLQGSRLLYQASQTVPADPAGAAAAYERLADSLLLRGAPSGFHLDSARARRSLPVMQSFARGQRALEEWDLDAADSAFQSAVGFDATHAQANLWLAQVRAWRGLSSQTWTVLAERSEVATRGLSERETRLAHALVLLTRHRYEEACRSYDELRRINDRDFAAWFGMGLCRTMDKTVVRDRTSSSGWRFRSSYHQAVESYGRAFEILPSVYRGYEHDAFERLRVLLLVTTDLVIGYGADRDSTIFYARPSWVGDSLALVPYPWQAIASANPNVVPPGFTEALERQRGRFRSIAAGWSSAFPQSAGAKYAMALSLELLADSRAIDTLRLARRLAAEPHRRLQYAAEEVMLRLRFGVPTDLAALRYARALADSLLNAPNPSAADASLLAPLAALRGRCGQAEALVRGSISAESARSLAPDLVSDAQALLVRSAMGCRPAPGKPSLRDVADAITEQHRNATEDARRWADLSLLYRPALLATPLDSGIIERLAGATDNKLIVAARAITRGEHQVGRETLAAFDSQWQPALGAPTPDLVYPAARFLAGLGDTTSAIRWLDRTLGGARTYNPDDLKDHAIAAAFVAAMVLRADLAAAVRDSAAARRWGTAAALLWADADPELRPVVQRMSQYSIPR